jgi:hypothetical protein
MIHFCFDRLGSNPGLGYPNLAADDLQPDQFDVTWPHVLPLRLLMYFSRANIKFQCHLTQHAPMGSWYPVALGWHDHSIDYFELMSPTVLQQLRTQHIKILFYYHEGDNPSVIAQLLNRAVAKHNLPGNCYKFVCANTAAAPIENFYYFDDHEHFFRYVNRRQSSITANSSTRSYQFTALNRTHKWWRASVMCDLWNQDILQNSLWSYNTECTINDDENDNPLELDQRTTWRRELEDFLSAGPYYCDQLNVQQHNDHRQVETNLYSNSYCHIVMETHYDADGSMGAFLTEKTYKCIKYGQPFVIVGTPGSLQVLRQHGYRVFDHVLDNSYDQIENNTQRWFKLRKLLLDLSQQDLHDWYLQCLDDVQHNQALFAQRQQGSDLFELANRLSTDHFDIV